MARPHAVARPHAMARPHSGIPHGSEQELGSDEFTKDMELSEGPTVQYRRNQRRGACLWVPGAEEGQGDEMEAMETSYWGEDAESGCHVRIMAAQRHSSGKP